MKRPTNIAIIAAVVISGAAVSALAATAFFTVALLVVTGSEPGNPISIAIIGMGVAGGFALLILAGLAAVLGMNMREFHDRADTESIAAVVNTWSQSVRGLLSSATRSWAAAFPSRNKNHKLSFRPSK